MFMLLFVIILGKQQTHTALQHPYLGKPWVSGPSVALEKEIVDFHCQLFAYPKNEPILLRLFKEGDRSKLLALYTSLDGEPGVFPIIIKHHHEGNLECVASAQNNTLIKPTTSNPHHLKVIVPVKDAKVVISSGKKELFEGATLELHCQCQAGTHVTYKWLLNGRPVSPSPLYYVSDNYLRIYRTNSEHSGSYACIAFNQYNNTVFNSTSPGAVITVRDLVSNPDISFTVLKQDSQNYSVVVSCLSTRGTPPVTFSLYNRKDLVANMTVEDRNATFSVPIVLDRHLGWLQCQADNGDRTAYSQWMPLEVVPVGGPVSMHYDYDIGENFVVVGLRFYCKAAKGTHPRFQWFLNTTLLYGRGSFYYVVEQPPERSVLLMSVGRDSAGTYHCQVSDSFDNATALSSKRLYLDKEVLNRLPVLVVAIVFGCFSFIIVLVSICCVIGVVFSEFTLFPLSSLVIGVELCFHGKIPDAKWKKNLFEN
uniref:Si:dkey-93h22.7 n=1 Tax=Sphaeramia orbicularis TaxID=375764 RepID=A0A672Y334_9TELE